MSGEVKLTRDEALAAHVGCPLCKTLFGALILDATQVAAARERWQWADLGPGVNDCPYLYGPAGDLP